MSEQPRKQKPLLDPVPGHENNWGKDTDVRFSKEEIKNIRGVDGAGKGGRKFGIGNNGMDVWKGLRMAKRQMQIKGETLTSAEVAAEKLAKLLAGLTGFLAGSFAGGSIYFIDRQRHHAAQRRPPPMKGRYGLLALMAVVGGGVGFQIGSLRFGYIFTTMSRPDSTLLHSFRRSIASISPHHPILGIRVAMPDNDDSEKKILDAVRTGGPLILNDVDAERYERYKMRQEERGLLTQEEEKKRELEREHQRRYEALKNEKKEKAVKEKEEREQLGGGEEEKEKSEGETAKRRVRRSVMKMEREKEKVKERVSKSWDN
uniref:Uncharacterized protein n=1 Tax=Paramoeba aestuarina TaxID=180227 RepID=A0A7S4JU81_9EUKA